MRAPGLFCVLVENPAEQAYLWESDLLGMESNTRGDIAAEPQGGGGHPEPGTHASFPSQWEAHTGLLVFLLRIPAVLLLLCRYLLQKELNGAGHALHWRFHISHPQSIRLLDTCHLLALAWLQATRAAGEGVPQNLGLDGSSLLPAWSC